MILIYPVIFTQIFDEKQTVLIEIPDFNILTEGYGITDAVKMAKDAIKLALVSLKEDNQAIPNPTNIKDIDIAKATFRDAGECFVALIDVNFKECRKAEDNKAVRRNATLPYWLNEEAKRANINVSEVLKAALIRELGVKLPYKMTKNELEED